MRQTVWSVRHGESLIRLLSSAQGCVNPQWAGFLNMIDRLLWEGRGTFAAGAAEPEQMIETMLRHSEEVKRNVPPERLLLWSVSEGWEPLCEFLEVPVPEVPLPAHQRPQGVPQPDHRRLASELAGVARA